jgi:radical SAM protein with 4Fe4S-binding SPASM domain
MFKMNWIVERLLKFTGSQKFLSAQLDITNACNLNCTHCYQPRHAVGEELPIEDWRKILDQYSLLAKKLYLRPYFCISGGEPTVSPLFIPIIEELRSRWPGVGINILTNGTNLSGEIVSVMTRFKVDVQISLDGHDSAKHDRIRGVGNFDKAIKGFKALQTAGLNATLQAVLSYRTAPWINEFFETAANLHAPAMNFTRFVPQGKGKSIQDNGADRPLSGPELRDAYSAIISASAKTGIYTSTNKPLFTLISPELGAHGKFGFQGLIIDCQGNLKVTSRADFRLGNILETGLEELFLRHPIMKDLRAGKIEGCGACRFYDNCGGDRNASFAAYGSFLKKDPGCWLSEVDQKTLRT